MASCSANLYNQMIGQVRRPTKSISLFGVLSLYNFLLNFYLYICGYEQDPRGRTLHPIYQGECVGEGKMLVRVSLILGQE